ncbi:MAG TPA: hypothetical protein VG328_07085 [Stellaceae bacterium]|jgi:hypothetical protein|nr:hypothetical protein [Stellaceae bacterium]
MARRGFAAIAAGVLLIGVSFAAFAQTRIQVQQQPMQTLVPPPPPGPPPESQAMAPADQGFVAHANVKVVNNTEMPQTIAGTGVRPFELMPHQQAQLDMRVAPPPAPAAPGSTTPVRFEYSIGHQGAPQCHGTIDMSLNPSAGGQSTVTNCVAHSLGTDGADCNIAVNAESGMCQGGLAFSAR